MADSKSPSLSKAETAKRRDATIKRMLATPPLKHTDEKHPREKREDGGKPKPASAARSSKSKHKKKRD